MNLPNKPVKYFTAGTCDQTVHLIITVEPMLHLACASVSLFAWLTRLTVVFISSSNTINTTNQQHTNTNPLHPTTTSSSL